MGRPVLGQRGIGVEQEQLITKGRSRSFSNIGKEPPLLAVAIQCGVDRRDVLHQGSTERPSRWNLQAAIYLHGLVGGRFWNHVVIPLPLEDKGICQAIRAREDRLRCRVASRVVHLHHGDMPGASVAQELFDEDVISPVRVDDVRISPAPVPGRHDPLKPPQRARQLVAQVEQQDPLITEQGIRQLPCAAPHQVFAECGDEQPVWWGDVQPL